MIITRFWFYQNSFIFIINQGKISMLHGIEYKYIMSFTHINKLKWSLNFLSKMGSSWSQTKINT